VRSDLRAIARRRELAEFAEFAERVHSVLWVDPPPDPIRQKWALIAIQRLRRRYLKQPRAELVVAVLHIARRYAVDVPDWVLGDVADLQRVARIVLNFWQREYLSTRNPVCAVRGLCVAYGLGLPVPKWVLDFWFDGAFRFWDADEADRRGEPRGLPGQEFANAFGIARRGATVWHLNDTSPFGDDMGFGFRVIESMLRLPDKVTETAVVEEVAGGPSKFSGAWRAWARFKRAFPEAAAAVRLLCDEKDAGPLTDFFSKISLLLDGFQL
jgi:hypothetical protein